MPKLYSYCIINDHGAAPNPFWGICTLAICKPVIRRSASVGDWIVATGSAKHNLTDQLVYAMRVSRVMTLKEYDSFCRLELPNKIPVYKTTDMRLKVGDCIYDFSAGEPRLRPSVHTEENKEKDLGGINVLLSDHFFYFGSKPIPLPNDLLPIVRQGQGHKSTTNASYLEKFVAWIETFKTARNKVSASPLGLNLYREEDFKNKCSRSDLEQDEADEILKRE